MRKIYRNFINKKEVELLESDVNSLFNKINVGDNKIIDRILNQLKLDFDFSIKEQSYYLIEHIPKGHEWHRDTGINNHMSWCEIGVSLLIKEPLSGGDTYYADDDKETNKIKIERNLYDLIAHTSNEWHMVEPHKGERRVFLMFI